MTVLYSHDAERQMERLDTTVQRRIKRYMANVATLSNPRTRGKGLSGNLSGTWRYRVGDYRVFCKIMDDKLIIEVIKVGHRRDVYDS